MMNVTWKQELRRPFSLIGIILWIGLVLLGIGKLNAYANTPGERANARINFPLLSQVHTQKNKATLVLFVHPKCNCSVATIAEMKRLFPKISSEAAVNIVFLKPDGFSDSDVRGELWKSALEISGAVLTIDIENRESNLYGAKTSGQTFLYDSKGHLVFEGGLTAARGHTGDSKGQHDILNFFLNQASWTPSKASVFGCGLNSPINSGLSGPN